MDVPPGILLPLCGQGPSSLWNVTIALSLDAGVYTRCVLMTSLHHFLLPSNLLELDCRLQELQDALRFVDYYVPRSDSVLSTEAYVLNGIAEIVQK